MAQPTTSAAAAADDPAPPARDVVALVARFALGATATWFLLPALVGFLASLAAVFSALFQAPDEIAGPW